MQDERFTRLIARREQIAKEREKLIASRKAITDLATEETREDLTEEEDTEFRAFTAKIATLDAELKGIDERISELSEEMLRDATITEGAAAVRRAQARVASVSESLTYQKNDGRSYFRDLVRMSLRMDGDDSAAERLRRHAVDVGTAPEFRDLNTTDTSGGFFVPPAWLMTDYLELARAGRPTANLCTNLVLPGGTDSINIPKVNTGTTTAIFETQNTSTVSETDLADVSVSAGVKTIAGMQDVSVQLLDQSPVAFDQVIFRDLVGDYATKVDVQVISGTNGNGQVKGILGSTGILPVTYTDTSATVGELYSKLADAIGQVHTNRFRPPTVIVMHPRRWAWLTAATDSDGRPLVAPYGPNNSVAQFAGVGTEGVVGQIQGLPVVTDSSIPINVGTGTNEDRILIMRAEDILLWESAIRTRVLPDVGSGTLTVRLQVYGYVAFTAERYPKSVAYIAGTGLTTPTF